MTVTAAHLMPGSPVMVPGHAQRRARPSKGDLEYAKLAIELLLLLLAIPWLVKQLARNPGAVSRRAAGKHLAGA